MRRELIRVGVETEALKGAQFEKHFLIFDKGWLPVGVGGFGRKTADKQPETERRLHVHYSVLVPNVHFADFELNIVYDLRDESRGERLRMFIIRVRWTSSI